VLQNAVERGQIAGAATLVSRDGSTQISCAGWRDVEDGVPIERDTIFRIASMTKPITSVAALMLADEGRIALTDPIFSMGSGTFRDARPEITGRALE
jgi:CubicO group peptidase (beta-lactamase class C family)